MFAQRYYKEQLAKRGTNIENFGLVLTPLKDTHLDNIATSWPRMGKKLNLYLLGLIASLILLIASLNYVFLAITQASTRLQEVGVRKITGATRPQLIIQFWLENFHFNTLSQPIGPALLSFSPSYIPGILVKIQPRNISETLRKLETEWTRYNDGKPLNYTFMDKAILFAILIACLGLFALSGLIAMNFRKQIGIRKVMGASVWSIFFLLNKSIFNLSLFSFLLAVPFAWYFMNKWLGDFAYRIEISWHIFILTWLIGLFLALFSVGYNSLKSALSNPVKSIQN